LKNSNYKLPDKDNDPFTACFWAIDRPFAEFLHELGLEPNMDTCVSVLIWPKHVVWQDRRTSSQNYKLAVALPYDEMIEFGQWFIGKFDHLLRGSEIALKRLAGADWDQPMLPFREWVHENSVVLREHIYGPALKRIRQEALAKKLRLLAPKA
jgi:hypothetical protein